MSTVAVDEDEATARHETVAPRVAVCGLEKAYGPRHALAGVSFELADGLTGLLGPNGAGKSTVMRCLAGICSWDRGRVVLDGIDAGRRPAAARRKVGFMPERAAFPAEMRVDAYLAFVAAAKGISRPRRGRAVELALGRAGLEDVPSRVVGNLSKGYRQRVGLAQALIGDPPVVVLDEPMAGLDPLNIAELRGVLADYAADHAVVFSTHVLPEARLLCDRLVVLGSGEVVYDGPAAGMAAGAAGPGIRRVRLRIGGTGTGPVAAVVESRGGRVARTFSRDGTVEAMADLPDEAAVAALARDVVAQGWSLLALEPGADQLEEVFRHAVAGPRAAGGAER